MPGQQVFVSRCAGCHGSDGNGGELGPAIATRVPSRTDEDLASLFRQGLPAAGMPAFPSLTGAETGELIRYLRTLRPRTGSGPVRTQVTLIGGGRVEGLVLNQSALDLQLLGDDRKIHLFRKSGESVSSCHLAVRLAQLQRPDERKPLQPARPDHDEQRRAHSSPSGSSACPTRRACR